MSDRPREPVVILGGGCAGLSMAAALGGAGVELTVLEPRSRYTQDRTWSFWEHGGHAWSAHARKRWGRLRVRGGGRDTVAECARTPYCCLPSETFYNRKLERLGTLANVSVEMGVGVDSIEERGDRVEVHTRSSSGASGLRSYGFAFDARPPRKPPAPASERRGGTASEPLLLQHFGGREIVFDRAVLDPSCATLMDFDVDQREGLHFVYTLPFAEDRALVESTFITPPGGPTPDYTGHVEAYCDRHFPGVGREAVSCETGSLPMTTAALGPPPTARVWPLGTRAGVARASTGYAFDAIQRDTARVARAWTDGLARPAPPRPRVLRPLDRMLLSLLGDRPELGPGVFGRLFAGAPSDAVLRFLNDRPTLRDAFRVAWAMPRSRMMTHVLARPGLWRL